MLVVLRDLMLFIIKMLETILAQKQGFWGVYLDGFVVDQRVNGGRRSAIVRLVRLSSEPGSDNNPSQTIIRSDVHTSKP